MKTKRLLCNSIWVGVALCAYLACSGSEVMTNNIIEKLGSECAEDRQHATNQIMAVRAAAILEAITVLKAEQTNAVPDLSRSVDCIRVLGRLRASEASPTLVRIIDWKDPAYDKPGGLLPVETLYPSISALTEIGKPATGDIIEALTQSNSDVRIRLYVKVLIDIEGPSGARLLLEETAPENGHKQNIEKAKQWIDKFCPSSKTLER